MDRNYVVQHNLVERYLRGELDENTREAFEVHFLEDSETLRELQVYEALREGMRQLAAEENALGLASRSGLQPAPKPQSIVTAPDFRAANQAWLPASAIAASCALMVVATLALWQWQELNRIEVDYAQLQALQQQVLSDPHQVYLRRTRGVIVQSKVDYDQRLNAPIILTVEPPALSPEAILGGESEENRPYQVTITTLPASKGNGPIFSRKETSNANGELSLAIPFYQMPVGEYLVQVQSLDGREESNYQLIVEEPVKAGQSSKVPSGG